MATRRFTARSKRRVSWNGNQVDMADLVTATPQFAVIVNEATLEAFPTPTVIRIRGSLGLKAQPGGGAPAESSVGLGIYLADSVALAAGSLQVPITDIGSDWIWWFNGLVGEPSAGQTELGRFETFQRIDVDSKAMRKVKVNQALVLVAQSINARGTGQIDVFGTVRVLLKAP